MAKIANVRKNTPALQRGLQLNLEFEGHIASFYRVLQLDGVAQTALVILNKDSQPSTVEITDFIQAGEWKSSMSNASYRIEKDNDSISVSVPANGVEVIIRNGEITSTALLAQLDNLMSNK